METNEFANYEKYSADNEVLAKNKTHIEVVFMGNSITEMWKDADPKIFEGAFINRGIGGQTTAQMLLRFSQDVLDLEPEKVVILAGTNDIAGNQGPVSLHTIAQNIEAMALLARARGIRPLICAVLPARIYRWSPSKNPAKDIPRLNAMIKELCQKKGFDFIDTFQPMCAPDGMGLQPKFHTDEVHLTKEGYQKLKEVVFEYL